MGVGVGVGLKAGVGWFALPETPESNEAQPLKITSEQHKNSIRAEDDIKRQAETAWCEM